jgi:hypothetical protein
MSLRSSNEPPSYLSKSGTPGIGAAVMQARDEVSDPDDFMTVTAVAMKLSGASFTDVLDVVQRTARPRTDEERALDSIPCRDLAPRATTSTQRRPSSAAPPGYHRIETPPEVQQEIAEVARLKRLRDSTEW